MAGAALSSITSGLAMHGSNGFGATGSEEMWIDVIRKMDAVYADLVASQIALEDQNLKLEQTRDFMTSVLGAMTDVLIVCDAQGTVIEGNRMLGVLTGTDASLLIGKPLLSLFEEADRAEIEACIGTDTPSEHHDWHLLTASGPVAEVSFNIAPRRDGRGHPQGLVLAGRPIGELRRAYRELDAAHQRLRQTQQRLLTSEKMAALGRLVAGVAHELNNPISFVFGNMYALKRYGGAITEYLTAIDAGLPPAELARLRETLRIERVLGDIGLLVDGTLEGAERVRDIVQDLRRFSSNQREEPEPFDLVRMIQTAIDWVVKTQRNKPRIVLDMPDTLEMTGLKGQLHQIIVNLVQNAVDALEDRVDATIRVSARVDGPWVSISVADNGLGVAAEDQHKIFEPFYTTKPIGAGTGLGLYVSYNMAEKAGGRLTYTDAPGGGACFTIRIPCHDRDE